ncbi:MAG: hypothetical protein SCH71_15235 [Desulfobulbaceae bacterium]|nr:hypothetical protein [Desulfobulbaceae bacterium]
MKDIHLTAEHRTILNHFGIHEDERLSADDLQLSTNIEPVKVNLILFDLVSHGLLQKIEQDDYEWGLYILSEAGRKFLQD